MATRSDCLVRLPSRPPERRIRLLIVDDSIVARTMLARMLGERDAFEIAATAATAAQALAFLDALRVDIILLDVEMPGTDGLTALPQILVRGQGARVLIVSSTAEHGAAATIKALTLGAVDTLLKPGAGSFAGRFADELAARLLRIGARDPVTEEAIALTSDARTAAPAAPIACLALGASTGGVNALSDFFRALPGHVQVPILVTQHLPPAFMPYFAAQLRELAGRPASVATEGARLVPGEILVAPGDGHLCLARARGSVRVTIDRAPSASGCMPSVDPMLASLGATFGAAGLGVVFSGMGRDGAIGASALVAAGGEVLVQDAASSVIWGMPGAVANAGLAAAALPPARIARRIGQRAGRSPWT